MLLLILSVLIQSGLSLHVIKTGRNPIWIWALILLPLEGPIPQAWAVEILPDLFRSRTAQRTARGLRNAMDLTAKPAALRG